MMNPRLYCRECGWHPHYRSHRAALRAARRHHCPPLHSLTDTAPLDAITSPEATGSTGQPTTAAPAPSARPTSGTPAPPPATGQPGARRWWQRLWHTLTRPWRAPAPAEQDQAQGTTPAQHSDDRGKTRP